MAVNVKANNDKRFEVLGDFQQALAFVKGFKGRKFDAATKRWSIPADKETIVEAALKAGLDVRHEPWWARQSRRQGDKPAPHVPYTPDEWEAMDRQRMEDDWEEEEARTEQDRQNGEALEREFQDRAKAMGLSEQAIEAIELAMNMDTLDDLTFASEARRMQVMTDLVGWYIAQRKERKI